MIIEEQFLDRILFLDVETVPNYENYEALPNRWKSLWDRKASLLNSESSSDEVYHRAGIYAEFGRIICISAGYLNRSGHEFQLRLKSFYGDDEQLLLKEFAQLLTRGFDSPTHFLCAHNGKEFDYPYICRRMLITGVEIPNILNIAGKKPWEVRHLDTMQLWKFGDFKSYTSLDLLAASFNIPTPKDDIDGSMIHKVYYEDHDLERIVTYCQKDVITLTNIFLKMNNLEAISTENIIEVE